MKKIGYINSKEDYLENNLQRLNLDTPTLSLEDKLNKLFYDKEITKRVSNLKSSVDIFRFYRRVIKEYITNNGEITLYGGYSQKNLKNNKKYTILVNLRENDNDKFWIWSSKKHQMKSLCNMFIKKFIDKGLVKIVPGKKNVDKCQNMLDRINNIKTEEYSYECLADEFWCK